MMNDPFLDGVEPVGPRMLTREEIESQLDVEGIVTYGDRAILSAGDAMWVQLFLFNDRPNRAKDPRVFKIASSAIDKIAATAIGRPWIVHPDGSKHFRGGSDKPEEIIQFQKQYAKGEMLFGWRNNGSMNVNVIAGVFPQYKDEVSRMNPLVVPYVSPLIFVKSESNGEITDGEVIHVQSVDNPGYDPQIAKISGICTGMLGDCMKELRAVGAAAPKRKLTAQQIIDSPQFKKIQSTVESLKKAYGLVDNPTKDQHVGFELEEYIAAPNRLKRQILGAAGKVSSSKIREPVGFELEDGLTRPNMPRRMERRGLKSEPENDDFALEESMWK